jgi:hypothetical protein
VLSSDNISGLPQADVVNIVAAQRFLFEELCSDGLDLCPVPPDQRRSAFQAGFDAGRYPPSSSAKLGSKTPDFIGSKQPLKADRALASHQYLEDI